MNSGRRQAFWRLRPLAGFAAAFCLQAAVWLAFGWIPLLILFLAAGPCMVLAKHRALRFACAGLLCGAAWITGWWAVELRPVQHLDGRSGIYSVDIMDYADSRISYGAVEALLEYDGREYPVQIYLSDGSPELAPGDTVILNGSLTYTGPHEDGICLKLSQEGEWRVVPGRPQTLRQRINVWNRALGDRVELLLDGSEAGILRALLTGDQSGIEPRVRAELSRSGLSHIVAVSGLHMTILAGLLLTAFGKKTGGILAIPVLVMFSAFTGFSPSSLRAVTLWIFLFAAWGFRRRADSVTSLFSALLLQTALNPAALTSVSLQLSFCAVLGLILLAPACADLVPARKRWSKTTFPSNFVRNLGLPLLTSFSASVFTAPLLVYYFGSLSLAAPITNLLALWAVAPAMVLGGVTVLISWISVPLASLLIVPVRLLLSWLLLVAKIVVSWPFAAMHREFLFAWVTAAAIVLLAIAAIRCGAFRNPGCKLIAAGTAISIVLGIWQAESTDVLVFRSDRGALTLTAVTGQGSLVLDPGPYGNGTMGQELAEYFWQHGIAAPDCVVSTGSHVSRAGALPDLCALASPLYIVAPADAYALFDNHPDHAYLLPEDTLFVPGGSLELLPCGRQDRVCWMLDLSGKRVLSVCGAQPRAFLALNAKKDITCDILVLDGDFLDAPYALEQLLRWTMPNLVLFISDNYSDPALLDQIWEGELLVLNDRQQYIGKLWRN